MRKGVKLLDKIYFARMSERAKIPSKRKEDGAYDVYTCIEDDYIILAPGEIKSYPVGIVSAFDPKYRIVFQERGSTGIKGLKVNAGLIDSGYRGEWIVILNNVSNEDIFYPTSKAICQAKVQLVPEVDIIETTQDEIMSFQSERGTGKLGSSGK
jgi:dUTP pyrophosphatase